MKNIPTIWYYCKRNGEEGAETGEVGVSGYMEKINLNN